MMIHVFYVNKGDMLTYDLSLAMGTVVKLQEAIQSDLSIPVDGQVMLVSGGEAMAPDSRVSSYSAGTDTCPIFLFNLRAIEEKNPPDVVRKLDHDNIRHRVEGSINMAPTLATLSTRTQLALELRDLSQEHESLCKKLVHQQHLQHQGWCAVVANLEDSLKQFLEETDVFISWYQQFLDRKSERVEMLQGFPESYEILSKMPILPSLRDIFNKPGSSSPHDTGGTPDTLLAFFIKLEDNQGLVTEAEVLLAELSQLNVELLNQIVEEKEKVLEAAATPGMKEVRGLENRLSALEQLIIKCSSLVREQEEYAQGFVRNQNRCKQLADPHILPDLSISHKQQLRNMEGNDDKLIKNLQRCMMSKQDLCSNLHARLRWTMIVEKEMTSLDGRISLQFENFKRLKYRVDKLEQIARAPAVYAQLCAEVCRRKTFAAAYRKWSQDAFGKSNEWYLKEVDYRKKFYQTVGNHFLKTFFQGLDRIPPQVMVSPVTELDDNLPCITEQEITSLKQNLPELEPWLMVHDANTESVSLVSTLSPDTPSDIVVLSPRTNHSSHGSLARALSPKFDAQITSQHTAPSTMESLSANSASVGDMVVDSGSAETNPDQSETVEHLMAKFEPFEDDDDISIASEDDIAPASLTEDSSAGFMTANFFPSVEPESRDLLDMSDTIAIQKDEINRLLAENSVYKQKCNRLTKHIKLSGESAHQEVQQLKETANDVRQNYHLCREELNAFQNRILNMVQTAPDLHRRELDEQLSAQRSSHEINLTELLAVQADKEKENSELKETVNRLKSDYDKLLTQMEEREAQHKVEFEAAVKDAEASVAERLEKEHTSYLDEIKGNADARLESCHSKLSDKDSYIRSLQQKVEHLQEKVQEESLAAVERIHELRSEFEDEYERRIEELQSRHSEELESINKLSEQTLNDKLEAALAQQQAELEDIHKTQMEELKSAADKDMSEEVMFQQQLNELRDELEQAKQHAVAENTVEVEAKWKERLDKEVAKFTELTEKHAESQEQEFQYRAAKMKESLQLANEMKYENKISHIKKEKDTQILELKREINAARIKVKTVMSESVVPVEPPPAAEAQALGEQSNEKDSHIKALQHELTQYKMSASSREVIHGDKVTVKSVSAGDKVILCYDERYRHYVVFSLSPVTYFVHSDSLEELGLNRSAPDEQRKTWLLAEVVEKEFCQAKKANNRFNVPINTKFYRVKAKPWSV